MHHKEDHDPPQPLASGIMMVHGVRGWLCVDWWLQRAMMRARRIMFMHPRQPCGTLAAPCAPPVHRPRATSSGAATWRCRPSSRC